MGSQRSKEDAVQKISTSVFVTNFLDQLNAKDLWKACKQYGYMVDAFIPNIRSKACKRFGFVCFIKVFDVEHLVNNLCTVWIGRHKIHANVARFQRASLNNSSNQFRYNGENGNNINDVSKDKGIKGSANSYAHVIKGPQLVNMKVESNHALVLDESCLNHQDYSHCLIGKEGCFHRKRVCISTTGTSNNFKSFKLIYQGKAYWVRAKEVPGWVPNFVEQNDEANDSDDETFEGEPNGDHLRNGKDLEGDSEIDVVPDTTPKEESPKTNGGEASVGQNEVRSEDPFNIYDLLNKKKEDNKNGSSATDSLKYPLGFTPREDVEAGVEQSNHRNGSVRESGEGIRSTHEEDEASEAMKSDSKRKSKEDVMESVCSGHFKKSKTPRLGGYILLLMEELVKVGQTMRYNMEGCMKNIEEIIESQGVTNASVGNSGGILCVWDSNSFKKFNATVSDYFVMIRGKVIIMGDFNEVHNKTERFGSVFNVQGANAFNLFISSAGLEEVPLGNCSFTWCHKSATKMSKLDHFLISKSLMSSCPNILVITLDRYLFNHRPILLRKSKYDNGPIPFRFFHYWFEVDGFEKLVEEIWTETPVDVSNAMLNLKKKLKYLKKKIRAWNNDMRKSSKNSILTFKVELSKLDVVIDKGEGNVDVINKRMNVVKSIQELEKLKLMEAAQKAKIKWAIEGDENSKYYHGILNKKRNQLSIRGVLVDGIWIDTPALVKNEFLSHSKNRFEKLQEARLNLNMDFPYNLTSIQQSDLETEVAKEEIKRAVWDCGVDKSSGPDGFTFDFYHHFWKLIENDVVDAVEYFFQHGSIPKGCNSSFIALIPKTRDANMAKDFRPISLIGSLYKIIAKILADRLVVVLGDIINKVQSDFVADRQILDGPFILNELFQWCKSKKKHSLIFKVDFKKAYDSVRWDYLDDVLKKFGFGDMWCGWIQGCLRSSWGSVIVNGSPMKEFQFFKGLKQSDPLSPFLFILIMESLHISFQRLVDAGSKVGGLMSRIQSWNEIVNSMVVRLSKWKMKTLPIGGRLTLLKSVLWSMPIYHMSIFKVPMKLSCSNGYGGSLLKVYRYGQGLSKRFMVMMGKLVRNLKVLIHLYGSTLFMRWSCLRSEALESCKSIDVATKLAHTIIDYSFRRVPRGGVEQTQFADLLIKVEGVSFVNMNDRWVWPLEGFGDFSVASVRKLTDDKRLPKVSSKTRWIKAVPIKVNVHAWKVRLDCLPTRINISRKGMDIESILCLICHNAGESLRHLFFNCHVAREIFRKITCWWDVSYTEVSSYEEWLAWILNLRLSVKHKRLLEGVSAVENMYWPILERRWNARLLGIDHKAIHLLFSMRRTSKRTSSKHILSLKHDNKILSKELRKRDVVMLKTT
ncbi:RNA-directed DNA polymerase, eukaryota [Tanacetum coccineum]